MRLYFLSLLFLLLSCKTQQKTTITSEDLCKTVSGDQKYRGKLGNENIDFDLMLNTMIEMDTTLNTPEFKKFVLDKKKTHYTKLEQDSLWKLQNKIDKRNIKTFIKLFKNKNTVIKTTDNKCKTSVIALLMHTPQNYKNAILKIIERKDVKNYLEQPGYANVKWHLTGRKGLPFEYEVVQENDSIN